MNATSLLLPEATIWQALNKEFRASASEQLPARSRLLQILRHLRNGHQLAALFGPAAPSLWLDGMPDIPIFAGILFHYRYVEIAGRAEDPRIVYFRLSPAGRAKLEEGLAWWRSLSLWQRLSVQLCG